MWIPRDGDVVCLSSKHKSWRVHGGGSLREEYNLANRRQGTAMVNFESARLAKGCLKRCDSEGISDGINDSNQCLHQPPPFLLLSFNEISLCSPSWF